MPAAFRELWATHGKLEQQLVYRMCSRLVLEGLSRVLHGSTYPDCQVLFPRLVDLV